MLYLFFREYQFLFDLVSTPAEKPAWRIYLEIASQIAQVFVGLGVIVAFCQLKMNRDATKKDNTPHLVFSGDQHANPIVANVSKAPSANTYVAFLLEGIRPIDKVLIEERFGGEHLYRHESHYEAFIGLVEGKSQKEVTTLFDEAIIPLLERAEAKKEITKWGNEYVAEILVLISTLDNVARSKMKYWLYRTEFKRGPVSDTHDDHTFRMMGTWIQSIHIKHAQPLTYYREQVKRVTPYPLPDIHHQIHD